MGSGQWWRRALISSQFILLLLFCKLQSEHELCVVIIVQTRSNATTTAATRCFSKNSQPSVALRLNKWATTKREWWNMQEQTTRATLQRNRVFIYTGTTLGLFSPLLPLPSVSILLLSERARVFDVISSQICLFAFFCTIFPLKGNTISDAKCALHLQSIKKQRHASAHGMEDKRKRETKKKTNGIKFCRARPRER